MSPPLFGRRVVIVARMKARVVISTRSSKIRFRSAALRGLICPSTPCGCSPARWSAAPMRSAPRPSGRV